MEKNTTGTITARVSNFLSIYRRTPHTTTGVPPAELLLGRIPRSRLDLLKPDISVRVRDKQRAQREGHDTHAKQRRFEVDEPVFIKEFPSGKHWVPGIITSIEGPQSYHVTLIDERVVRRHVDHISGYAPTTTTTPGVELTIPASVTSSATAPTPLSTPNIRRSTRNAPPPNYLYYDRNFKPRQD